MKLILVRHGETDWNLQEKVQGQGDIPLNRKGKEQARKVALRLKSERIEAIYSSDLTRARQTARAIAAFHKIPVQLDALLRERRFGDFEGISIEEWNKAKEKSGLPKYMFRPPGGENYVDLQKRARRFLANMRKKHSKENVLVVSHGGFIRTMIAALTNEPLSSVHEMKQHNTAVNVIEVRRGSPAKIHYLNSTEHL